MQLHIVCGNSTTHRMRTCKSLLAKNKQVTLHSPDFGAVGENISVSSPRRSLVAPMHGASKIVKQHSDHLQSVVSAPQFRSTTISGDSHLAEQRRTTMNVTKAERETLRKQLAGKAYTPADIALA
ncbi:MAG: hypothetical protein ACRDYX_06830, partial [Egibacteraceae bacterium]